MEENVPSDASKVAQCLSCGGFQTVPQHGSRERIEVIFILAPCMHGITAGVVRIENLKSPWKVRISSPITYLAIPYRYKIEEMHRPGARVLK